WYALATFGDNTYQGFTAVEVAHGRSPLRDRDGRPASRTGGQDLGDGSSAPAAKPRCPGPACAVPCGCTDHALRSARARAPSASSNRPRSAVPGVRGGIPVGWVPAE